MTEISSSKTFDELFTRAEKNPPAELSSSPQHTLPPSGDTLKGQSHKTKLDYIFTIKQLEIKFGMTVKRVRRERMGEGSGINRWAFI